MSNFIKHSQIRNEKSSVSANSDAKLISSVTIDESLANLSGFPVDVLAKVKNFSFDPAPWKIYSTDNTLLCTITKLKLSLVELDTGEGNVNISYTLTSNGWRSANPGRREKSPPPLGLDLKTGPDDVPFTTYDDVNFTSFDIGCNATVSKSFRRGLDEGFFDATNSVEFFVGEGYFYKC